MAKGGKSKTKARRRGARLSDGKAGSGGFKLLPFAGRATWGLVRGLIRRLPRILVALFVFSVVWVEYYRFAAPPTTLYIAGQAAAGYDVKRTWVPISRISPFAVRAVIGGEDQKFCSHWGFDLSAVRSAVSDAQNGGRMRGASTISQQTAKNAFLWHGSGITSAVRKGFEAYFTILIELLWPKTRIMEVYLNVAEFGPGVFGVEAAAKTYFGKTARTLSAREAALLAAVLPSPKKWSAAKPGPYVVRRAAVLERRGWIVKREGLAQCVRSAE